MAAKNRQIVISALWFQGAVLTFLVGFSILGYLSYRIYGVQPPVPRVVVSTDGHELFSHSDIMSGQHIFQKYGLMQYGTIFGHGAYLGPDFTAQYLHIAALKLLQFYKEHGLSEPEAEVTVREDFKRNAMDDQAGRLVFSPGQVYAFEQMLDYYRSYFGEVEKQSWVKRPQITDQRELRPLVAYFAWATWVSTSKRPGSDHSYTNNWPYEPLVDNYPIAGAVFWSVISLIALLGGAGLLFFFAGRYDLLSWRRAADDETAYLLTFRPPEETQLTPSQHATVWYFIVVSGLFLAQGLLGGLNGHYHAQPGHNFYGFPIHYYIPYNLSRTWHVQLALFWITSSFLAMGIFLAPMIAGREPRRQSVLAILLFATLVIVVVPSLIGEALSIKNIITVEMPWFWFGMQGWEYLDLGRFWQILLIIGMTFWVAIIYRGLRGRLRQEHYGNLPWLFMYSAFSIPLFYAAGIVFWRDTHFAIVDFWRFWVVHLWAEDFFELFTTIIVAYIFVLFGTVTIKTATRIIYLDIIIYSIGGVVGTMHHVYFSGTSPSYMALGACFSAMEVIPLLLLTLEGWRFMGVVVPKEEGRSILQASSKSFPHKWPMMFLVTVGIWNFLGAGIFGFLINLPIVSYYEIGTQFTANHSHGALMGVYGMLGIAFFMFVARYFVPYDRKSNFAMALSFWCLNLGLLYMVTVTLIPVGALQLFDSLKYGYWHARAPDFFRTGAIPYLAWARIVGDLVFILGGILPVVYLAARMYANRARGGKFPIREGVQGFTHQP